MRVTFFIGNGFDLNMGLKTGYDSFYDSLSGKKMSNSIVKAINRDKNLWSDMEEGLGLFYDSEVAKDDDGFIEAKHELEIYLEEYLENEQNKANYSDTTKISSMMKNSIVNFFKELNRKGQEDIAHIIKGIIEPIEYTFIVFNYTNIFDKCIDITKKGAVNVFSTHIASSSRYTDSLGNVLHVNGTIGDGIILGIDNCGQTRCKTMNDDSYVSNYLIKGRQNDIYGQMRTEDAQRILNESIIICIYGMALGKTDKMWWKRIAEWLNGGVNRRLIIYSYKKEGHRNDVYSVAKCNDEVLNRFKEVSDVNEDNWEIIKQRIIIKENPHLFNIKLYNESGAENLEE